MTFEVLAEKFPGAMAEAYDPKLWKEIVQARTEEVREVQGGFIHDDPITLRRELDEALARLHKAINQRDNWIRLFNELDRRITHHKKDKHGITDEVDERLYHYRNKVLDQAREAKVNS